MRHFIIFAYSTTLGNPYLLNPPSKFRQVHTSTIDLIEGKTDEIIYIGDSLRKQEELANASDSSDSEPTCKYSDIVDIDNIELGLKRTKSGAASGLDDEIKATYSENPDKLKALSDKLKSHKYKPSPSKKI